MSELLLFHGWRSMPDAAKEAILNEHYLKRKPPVSFAVVDMAQTKCKAVVTFGYPPSRHLQLSISPTAPNLVVELNRLWVASFMPKNTASAFLSKALRMIEPRIVVSYADTAVGHVGYVYRASNFYYAGWTDMDRKTPRFDYVPLNGNHSRDAFRTGQYTRVRRKPKVRYWTVSGNRRERRQLEKIAAWPKLNWHEQPPPTTEHGG